MPIIFKRLQLETFVSSTCGLITTNTTGRVFLLSYDDCADIILVCAVNIPSPVLPTNSAQSLIFLPTALAAV